MKDSVFIDSNILVYAYSSSEPLKQFLARQIISENISFISTQVLNEFANVLNKKFKVDWSDIQIALKENTKNNLLVINNENTILGACQIAGRYIFSFYDSLIVSSALESGCTILYSEDFQNGQIIDGKLKIINPFI